MSITRNSYSANHPISPYIVRVSKDTTQSDFIIIDDIEYGGGAGSMFEEASGSIVWLQVEINNKVTVLLSAPDDVAPFTPNHEELALSRIYIKSAEVFVIHYTSAQMSDDTDRDEVTGYQLGTSSDILYIKIDHNAGNITMYQ